MELRSVARGASPGTGHSALVEPPQTEYPWMSATVGATPFRQTTQTCTKQMIILWMIFTVCFARGVALQLSV